MELNNKVAIVTGGSSGIGRAIVRALHSEGSHVVACWAKNEQKVVDLLHELDPDGKQTHSFGGDLSGQDKVEQLFAETISKFGSIDILINCAGGTTAPGALPNTTAEDWRRVLDANLISAVLCTQEATKHMKPGSKIVNIGSVLGESNGGREGIIAYSAAKAALHNFTQTSAKQLVPEILVNAVSPGRTWTEAYEANSPELNEELKKKSKIGRWIEPAEMADAVVFACKNDALVGEIVSVNAGFFF